MGRPQEAPSALGDASPFRFAIVVSRFNQAITDSLRDAAVGALAEAGAAASQVDRFEVPGAYELPQAARAAAASGAYDAIVCLGCVVRGETPHFDYISAAVAHGIMDAAGDTGVPMAFGVLTVDTQAQAVARAGTGPDNKGREAAAAAIEMALVYRKIEAARKARKARKARSARRTRRTRRSGGS
ncbi:MAG TPA: 6,7-dimethyl-8-ribityllumazine synthase [Vicinamibacterales bacterium]